MGLFFTSGVADVIREHGLSNKFTSEKSKYMEEDVPYVS
jgi:hypothetical protein